MREGDPLRTGRPTVRTEVQIERSNSGNCVPRLGSARHAIGAWVLD